MINLKYSLIALSIFAVTGCMENSSTNGNNETPAFLTQEETLVTAEHFNTLIQRVIPDFVAREQSNATKKGTTLDQLAQEYLTTLTSEGAWPDVYKEKILALRDSRISKEGVITIKAQQYRTQEQNREDALERLAELIRSAMVVQKKRRETKPTRASKERRLKGKSIKSQTKSLRGRVKH